MVINDVLEFACDCAFVAAQEIRQYRHMQSIYEPAIPASTIARSPLSEIVRMHEVRGEQRVWQVVLHTKHAVRKLHVQLIASDSLAELVGQFESSVVETNASISEQIPGVGHQTAFWEVAVGYAQESMAIKDLVTDLSCAQRLRTK